MFRNAILTSVWHYWLLLYWVGIVIWLLWFAYLLNPHNCVIPVELRKSRFYFPMTMMSTEFHQHGTDMIRANTVETVVAAYFSRQRSFTTNAPWVEKKFVHYNITLLTSETVEILQNWRSYSDCTMQQTIGRTLWKTDAAKVKHLGIPVDSDSQ